MFLTNSFDDLLTETPVCSVTESPTYENISKQLVLKKVDCLRVGGLGEQLRVPRNKREAIQRENPDDQAGQTRATVKYWLDVDPTPYPWRRLVTALEESSDEHKAVKSVKQYVEPLTGSHFSLFP